MPIATEAPRGGVVEALGGAERVLCLTLAEIERFEDRPNGRGIYAVYFGFRGLETRPTAAEVRDLVALGLVGGGMRDSDADALVTAEGAEGLLTLYQLANGLLGAAFNPDWDQEAPPGKPAGATPDDTVSATTSAAPPPPDTGQPTSVQ